MMDEDAITNAEEAMFIEYKKFLHDVISKEKDLDVVRIEQRLGDKYNTEKNTIGDWPMHLREGEALEDGYYLTKMRAYYYENKPFSAYDLHSDFVRKYEESGLISKKNGKILLSSLELTQTVLDPKDPKMLNPKRCIIAVIKFEYDK
jgi:hypothetical protein